MEKTVPNLCTDFGLEHDLFLHCGQVTYIGSYFITHSDLYWLREMGQRVYASLHLFKQLVVESRDSSQAEKNRQLFSLKMITLDCFE